jgi:Uma2 family endonuclease
MAEVRAGATIDDLYRVEGKAEIVHGELVLMSPTGFLPGRAGGAIFRSLALYEEATGLGYAFPDNVGFLVNLPHRKSFSPDAALYVGEPSGGKFLSGSPLFAAEVRSEDDYGPAAEKRLAAKRADYFAAGTRVVWDADVLRDELVRSYSADRPEEPRVFRRGDVADAEPALPGWSMPVDDLFKGRRGAGS